MFDDTWMLAAPARARQMVRELYAPLPRAEDATPRRPRPSSPLDISRPVLIIDGGSRADLGLARSLGFAGIPVHLLTSERASITTQSRYVTQTHAFPHPGAPDVERVARIRAVAKSLRSRPVVLPSSDFALRFLSRCRVEFADIVDHDLPDEHVVTHCLDEARIAELPLSRSRTLRDQDFVTGAEREVASVHVYVDPSGRILGSFTGIEARAFRPDGGIAVTGRWNEQLAALAVDIVAGLRYSGFAILRFERDAHQDAFRLIEIHCRYGTWTELHSRCGCNFPVAAYATITGQSAPVIAQREGVRCRPLFALDDPAPFFWQLLRREAN